MNGAYRTHEEEEMPGAFAHMVAAEQAQLLAQQQGLRLISHCAGRYPQWLQAGAIGPDYPTLFESSRTEGDWANRMHREKSGDMVRAGIWWLYDRNGRRDEADIQKATAWLTGYLSHIVLDATLNPVIRTITETMKSQQENDQRCEQVMEAHLCRNRMGYELMYDEWSDNLRRVTDRDSQGLDPAIRSIWSKMLKQTYEDAFETTPPVIDNWHRSFLQAIDEPRGDKPFFRHAAAGSPFVHLDPESISAAESRRYVEMCLLPAGNRFDRISMHYDEILAFAVDTIVRYWEIMEAVLAGNGDLAMPELSNWDLDRGSIGVHKDAVAELWLRPGGKKEWEERVSRAV